MYVALWIVQGLLALAYVLAGAPKATQPLDALSKRMGWVSAAPTGLVRFVGVAEVLGAIGLILPLLTGILPWLTIAAAIGLVVVQVLAFALHLSRGETRALPVNVLLLLLALFVVIGRVAIVPAA